MKLRSIGLGLLLLLVGAAVGAAGSNYWNQQMRKAEGTLALVEAHNAERKGDLDTAIWYATQAYVLHPDLPTAGDFAKELTQKRAKAACPGK